MKYLLFDQRAISIFVSRSTLQSIEYHQGKRLIEHICGKRTSEILEDVYIDYTNDGILFVGKRNSECFCENDNKIFCVDLTTCNILSEESNPANLLTVMQKVFRTTLKIWNRQPFSSSERINQTKSIVFPFVMPDRRRIVIERSNNVDRLAKRNIDFPLLAYKYSSEEPHGEEKVNTSVLVKAGEAYINRRYQIQRLFPVTEAYNNHDSASALGHATGGKLERRENFAYWNYETQYKNLTESQKYVVDFSNLDRPLRVDGAAGTGKTLSLLMRAYRLLVSYHEKKQPYRIIFFSHSVSTCQQEKEIFGNYPLGASFMQESNTQSIRFTTLLDFCKKFSKIEDSSVLDLDAGNAKSYQLQLIQQILEDATKNHTINTYLPLLSKNLQQVFSELSESSIQNTCSLLQHEFSIQIKGRTDCTLDSYKELSSIKNGLFCETETDKEFIFRLFTEYQKILNTYNNFDIDDVVLETLSRMNAPVWRRLRSEEGYDYIFVDEMHLFNINEQSVFHFLTKDYNKKEIPICFALDYCQAIGDRGNTANDYIENAFGKPEKKKYHTVFRNSPLIANFCASIAASGVLMFQSSFENPYDTTQNNFTIQEERKAQDAPILYMFKNDNEMITALGIQLDNLIKKLHCKQNEIAIISFEPLFASEQGARTISDIIKKKVTFVDNYCTVAENEFLLTSPYFINGLEFQAVILLGVDEGRVPQTIGTNDISQHFVKYSAYNLLYLSSSRAKYCLILMGSFLNGRSSCLEHSIEAGYLETRDIK